MLADKLRLKAGMRVAVANAPLGFSLQAPGVVVLKSLARNLDSVLVFANTQKELKARWPKAVRAVAPGGALWVAYPKKSSGVPTDLGTGQWDATKASGWNAVARIRIDDTWAAVRFKHVPGLETERQMRQQEAIRDRDGMICVDRVKRIVTAPKDLQKLLAGDARASETFDGLSFTNRKEYVVWILGAKKAQTRSERLARAIDKLAKGKSNPGEK